MSEKKNAQDKGRTFEKVIAERYGLDEKPNSGAGKWFKLDVGKAGLIISCKFTTNSSINISQNIIDEAVDAAFGPGGTGEVPVIVAGMKDVNGKAYAIIELDQLISFIEKNPEIIKSDLEHKKIAEGKRPSLFKDLDE